MNRLSSDVVRDLWVLVEAGEASADSRALVEEQLAADPALAAELRATTAARALPATAPPPLAVEREALERTRRRLSVRTQCFAVALFFTLLPFSILVRDGEIVFLLVRDAPTIAAVWWLVAAVMWGFYLRIRRGLSVPGL
jgi:anti-sigma factor RsiW